MSIVKILTPTEIEINKGPLKVYNYYRLALAGLILAIFLGGAQYSHFTLGLHNINLFNYTLFSYLAFAIVNFIALLIFNISISIQRVFTNLFIDIIAITLLMHASGGLNTGYATLIASAVAFSGILLNRQLAFLIAALATVSVLTETIFTYLYESTEHVNFVSAGLHGLMFFIIAAVFRAVSMRLRASTLLAEESAKTAEKLSQLNQFIVQRMQTGIIVVNTQGNIETINQAAKQLISYTGSKHLIGTPLKKISPKIASHLLTWRKNSLQVIPPFQENDNSAELRINFAALSNNDNNAVLIFLENNSQIAKEAQQIKLASLGRLTASIAHEIRNPLSAISYAAQLLNESEVLNKEEQRMAHIIEENTWRMNQIIDNILQLSRRNQSHPKKISLSSWLHVFKQQYLASQSHDNHITILCDDSNITVNFDATHLSQIVNNLVDNGLRYSEKVTGKRTITLKVTQYSHSGSPVLQIIDQGHGITEAQKKNLFEPFFTTEKEGTGLGLYLSKELCESNHANLHYKTLSTGESCFQITFSHPKKRLESF